MMLLMMMVGLPDRFYQSPPVGTINIINKKDNYKLSLERLLL